MPTCIVGLRDDNTIYLGGDSATANTSVSAKSAYPKVFARDGFLIGGTTSWRMLQYDLMPMPRDDMIVKQLPALRTIKNGQREEERGGTFLVGINDFEIQSDYQVAELQEGYMACGSGYEYALGSMFSIPDLDPVERIGTALEAASYFNPFVRPPHIIASNTYDPTTGENEIKWHERS